MLDCCLALRALLKLFDLLLAALSLVDCALRAVEETTDEDSSSSTRCFLRRWPPACKHFEHETTRRTNPMFLARGISLADLALAPVAIRDSERFERQPLTAVAAPMLLQTLGVVAVVLCAAICRFLLAHVSVALIAGIVAVAALFAAEVAPAV